MFKRANKMTALLVAAAAVVSLVPATGVNAADYKRIESKDGTVYNVQAYKDGCFVIDGDVEKEDEDNVYFQKNGKNNLLEDLDSGDDFEGVTSEKYLEMQGGDYFVDLSNGKVTDDNVREDNADDAATALRKAVKKDTDGRYAENSDVKKDSKGDIYGSEANPDLDKAQLPGNKFGDTWYETRYVPKKAIMELDGTTQASEQFYNVYTDAKGKYIDADYNIGKIKVETTTGSSASVTLKNTDTDKLKADDDVQARVSDAEVIGQDSNNIYRTATITVTSKTAGISEINGRSINQPAFTKVAGSNLKVSFDVIQKISKAQASDDIDGAKYAKTVNTYVISDEDAKTDAIDSAITGASDVQYTVVNGKVIAYSKTAHKIQTIELKSKSSYYYTDMHDVCDDDITGIDTDVDGNVWMVDGGFVYKWDNDEDWDKVYKVDGLMSHLSVYNKDNMAVWSDDDDEVYSLIGNKEEKEEEKPAETAKGWVQATDGTWTYVNDNGVKAAGWTNLAGTWYYLDPTTNVMKTGWVQDGGNWYFCNDSGAMQTGWVNPNGTWYFLNNSGAMQTGWVQDNSGNWYFCNGSGAMQANTVVDGYTLGANGAWIR